MQQWQQMADGAWADYTKIAGKSKQAKPIIQQVGGLLKHITGGGGAGGGRQQGQPPAQQGQPTVPPPPSQGAAPAASPQATTVPPPPGASNPLQESATGAVQDAMMKSQDALQEAGGKKEAEEAATIQGMDKGLEAAGFTPEQRREVIKAKIGGAAMRAKSMHPVKVSNPDGTQVPALQDPTTGEVFGPDG